jgi:hypothetical protein
MRAVRVAIGALASALATVGCALDGATASCDPVRIAGTWVYTGQQTTPELRDLTGTARIDTTTALLGGTFELQEFANGVLVGTRTGVITGCQTSTAVELQFSGSAFARRHLGNVRGDTISGEWFSQDAATTARGAFRLRRGALP